MWWPITSQAEEAPNDREGRQSWGAPVSERLKSPPQVIKNDHECREQETANEPGHLVQFSGVCFCLFVRFYVVNVQ